MLVVSYTVKTVNFKSKKMQWMQPESSSKKKKKFLLNRSTWSTGLVWHAIQHCFTDSPRELQMRSNHSMAVLSRHYIFINYYQFPGLCYVFVTYTWNWKIYKC